jgi:hypothetical protein
MPTALPPSRRPTAEHQLARPDIMGRFQVCAIGMILLALVITGTPSDSTVLLSANDYVAMMLAP